MRTAKTVQISTAVANALNAVGMTPEDFLRQALNVQVEGMATAEGVTFPEGTAFLAWYKDRPHWGHVKAGAIEIMGDRFTSVSSAAVKITGRPTNGWDFWQCKMPGKAEFVRINKLRASEGVGSNGKH
jgi:hypothetical protein